MVGRSNNANNPEARLQASVARDLKLQQMEEHSRSQAITLGAAKWEVKLIGKDEIANIKRREEQIKNDSRISKITNTENRRRQLDALYQADELQYEEELHARGLAFRKDRT